ncbi:glycosyltransferase [Paenibacillus sp. LHD-38]|uniref:glycosyltransferase n=1 Tax=Paenibacillus sp. LHD-38 TaxID=3072143 RepID=UPI00280C7977|nr:glycosyltransferase [Paenibacillus sp. LHD-38]MDQ8738188.1 glycosyltransferase [Paenibacillus sp. LHD-38]
MKSKFLIAAILCAIVAASSAPLRVQAIEMDHRHGHEGYASPVAVKLKEDSRKLWMEHALWTRNYIVSALSGLEDKDVMLKRLLKNQQDIGDSFKPFYGEAVGNELTVLLQEHIAIAGKLVGALASGNQANAAKFNKEWHRNADDIAAFLSKKNPNWSEKALKDLLYVHLQLLSEDVMARLQKNWDADALTEGIIKQFPQTFN